MYFIIRRILDKLYLTCGALAALCLVSILCVILMQVTARWLLIPFPGSSEYAGYLMATSSFLAFPYALNAGAHIRVTLFLRVMGRFRQIGEIWCFIVGTAVAIYLSWFAWKMIYWSVKLGDISQGQDAMPLWIVQLPAAIGASVLAVCFADNLLTLLLSGKDNIHADNMLEHEA